MTSIIYIRVQYLCLTRPTVDLRQIMEERSHCCCCAKVVSITYSECVPVALVVTHANRMPLVRPYFPHCLIKGTICGRKLLKMECCFSFSTTLSPCDFDLIPKMKEPLRGIRFRTVSEILQAVDRSIRTINTTAAAKGILQLPHRWQRVVHNAGDYIEGQ